jgi:glutathione S-transferase
VKVKEKNTTVSVVGKRPTTSSPAIFLRNWIIHRTFYSRTMSSLATPHPLADSTITYFPLPGRAEPLRLCFIINHINFNDQRIPGKTWQSMKADSPWGSMPYLTLPDKTTRLGQSHAQFRFVAKHTQLYPEDPLAAARVDELMDALEDVGKINGVGRGLEKDAKNAARLAAVTGPEGATFKVLAKIDAFIRDNGDGAGGHSVGSSLTIADLYVFSASSMLGSGFFDGVPPTVTDSFQYISAVRKAVSSINAVQAHYANPEGKNDYCINIEKHFAAAKDLVVNI